MKPRLLRYPHPCTFAQRSLLGSGGDALRMLDRLRDAALSVADVDLVALVVRQRAELFEQLEQSIGRKGPRT